MQQFFESFGLVYSPRFVEPLYRIATFLALGLLTLKLIDSALKRLMYIVPGEGKPGDDHVRRRAETLRQIVRGVGRTVVGVSAALYAAILLTGFDATPLLAGAGIVSLAVAFGAQSLVKDVIAGFFVLLEDQFGVGDTVRIAGHEGTVEEMSLRVTVLRSGEGEVHSIPNGNIQTVTVLSRDWRRANVDVSVSRKEELGRVFSVLAQVGEKLAQDMPAGIIDKPAVVGVEKLTGAGIKIRVSARTLPSRHGDVEHEWRRRIKGAFDQEGIQLVSE